MTRKEYAALVNARLEELLAHPSMHPVLRSAMHYSLSAGGKRIRPVLNLMANEMCGGDTAECLDLACAIEMLHTYSLIHDDLPAMDNDEMRRGKPTSHIVFGEAFAILAGDGLLSEAFAVMIRNALRHAGRSALHLAAMQTVADGSGTGGMLTGQCADIENEGQILTESELKYIHTHKTGDMITASLVSGAQLAGAPEEERERIREFGDHVGLAFQIIDDILDIEGTAGDLGKTPGKDLRARKFTFPTLFGIARSREMAEESTRSAVSALEPFGEAAAPLRNFALEILKRGS